VIAQVFVYPTGMDEEMGDCHDIAEILLKVALNIITLASNPTQSVHKCIFFVRNKNSYP
jgi:hypothetical protein